MLVVAIIYLIDVRDISESINLILALPVICLILILILYVIIKIPIIKFKITGKDNNIITNKYKIRWESSWSTPVIYVAAYLSYILMLRYIGFIISTLLFVPTISYLLGSRDWKELIITPLVVSFFLYYLFSVFLRVPLP